jgi:Helix-turn-helix domain
MTRHTTFRYCLDPTSEQRSVLVRHAGASRFAFNQCLRMVKDALSAPTSASGKLVPWSGFDPINAFNFMEEDRRGGPDVRRRHGRCHRDPGYRIGLANRSLSTGARGGRCRLWSGSGRVGGLPRGQTVGAGSVSIEGCRRFWLRAPVRKARRRKGSGRHLARVGETGPSDAGTDVQAELSA